MESNDIDGKAYYTFGRCVSRHLHSPRNLISLCPSLQLRAQPFLSVDFNPPQTRASLSRLKPLELLLDPPLTMDVLFAQGYLRLRL